jgi:hypothetical protein
MPTKGWKLALELAVPTTAAISTWTQSLSSAPPSKSLQKGRWPLKHAKPLVTGGAHVAPGFCGFANLCA